MSHRKEKRSRRITRTALVTAVSLDLLAIAMPTHSQEQEASTVAVRTRGGEDLGSMPVASLLARLREELAGKGPKVSGLS